LVDRKRAGDQLHKLWNRAIHWIALPTPNQRRHRDGNILRQLHDMDEYREFHAVVLYKYELGAGSFQCDTNFKCL